MRKVVLCIPSARPVEEAAACLVQWHKAGYGLSIWRDDPLDPILVALTAGSADEPQRDTAIFSGKYPGYAQAVNAMAKTILDRYPEVEWIVIGGDDTLPDPCHHPDVIARELVSHFKGTFGVMQPTGDRWAGGSIDLLAGSAWIGREWCERAHQGRGPLYREFQHMFVDEGLKASAEHCGVYLMRPDLIHHHSHFTRDGLHVNQQSTIPPHLAWCWTDRHWQHGRAVLERMRANKFAECTPLERTTK